jgi:hypothetical protein
LVEHNCGDAGAESDIIGVADGNARHVGQQIPPHVHRRVFVAAGSSRRIDSVTESADRQ